MKKRFWRGDDGKKRNPKVRWASMRSGYAGDGGFIVFRWGEGLGINQKVVISEDVAEQLALSYVKNAQEIEQSDE